MVKRKPIGWFKDPKIRISKPLKVLNIFEEEDKKLPVLADSLTRAKIFDVLVEHCADSVSGKLQKSSDEAPHVLELIGVFRSITEIIAYQLSTKKPAGIGSKSKDRDINSFDTVLQKLKRSLQVLQEIRLTAKHREFSPVVEANLNELREFHERTIKQYIYSYKREDQFLIICGSAIDSLKTNGFSAREMKQIVNEAVIHFKNQGFKGKVKDIDRIFRTDYYEFVYDEKLDYEGFNPYTIGKKSKNKPNK